MSDWKSELGSFFEKKRRVQEDRQRSAVENFIRDVVTPAFQEIKREMERHGRTVSIRMSASSAQLIVQHNGADELTYRVQGRNFPERIVPIAEIICKERKGVRLVKNEVMFRTGQDYTIDDIPMEEVIQHFLTNYMSRTAE